MINVYVLNDKFERIAYIDTYASLIWSKSYYEAGECELYIPAENDMIDVLKIGNYLMRSDDDMLCIIDNVKIDTDAENGNYIIASGHDVKDILRRRIIWNTINFNGTIENYMRKIIKDNLISPADNARAFKDGTGNVCVKLGTTAGYGDGIQEQCSYANVGEKIQSICESNGYGIKCTLDNKKIKFDVIKGADNGVIFSDKFENLATTNYNVDVNDVLTSALVGGEGEGVDRVKISAGGGESFDRYEVFVDVADMATETSLDEITDAYPDADWIDNDYIINQFDFAYKNNMQLDQLKDLYPNGEVKIKLDCNYYRCYNIRIGYTVVVEDADMYYYDTTFYKAHLLTRGYEEIDAHNITEKFEGDVVPDATFTYKIDYDLGDIVTVVNAYGISAKARIINILECFDDNGQKFEITLGG